MKKNIFLLAGVLLLSLGICIAASDTVQAKNHAQKPENTDVAESAEEAAEAKAESAAAQVASVTYLDPAWEVLYLRLVGDGFSEPQLLEYYASLSEYHPAPMVIKIKELHRNAMARKKPRDPNATPASPYRIYKDIVHTDSVKFCRAYLEEHQATFASMEETYGVPKEIVVALLYVETKLGTYLGKDNVMWSLSSMSLSNLPDHLGGHLDALDMEEFAEDWLSKHLTTKSAWAYSELKAFLRYCLDNSLSPVDMPGSVYGAIGICQFMPSNIPVYGADGNEDGVVNLFDPADAIHSTGKYLKAHGWVDNPDVPQQRSVLKRYNNITAYANTILALGDSVKNNKVHLAPPDAPRKARKK